MANIEIDKINNFINISKEEKEFLITRTCRTFQQQYIFYYELSNNKERAMIRAIEETISIFHEREMYRDLDDKVMEDYIEKLENELKLLRN
jgi:hypothetical protein